MAPLKTLEERSDSRVFRGVWLSFPWRFTMHEVLKKGTQRFTLQHKFMRVDPDYAGWLKGWRLALDSEISVIEVLLRSVQSGNTLIEGQDMESFLEDYLFSKANQLRQGEVIMEEKEF